MVLTRQRMKENVRQETKKEPDSHRVGVRLCHQTCQRSMIHTNADTYCRHSFFLKTVYEEYTYLKPHCIQSSRVLVPAGTSKSMLRHHGIHGVHC
jgi:hypothetical protein